MCHIKIIYGDGILGGESLLRKLGIAETCRIVLDHHHLLSAKIGAWPKKFGLVAWNTRLKDDCSKLVKSYDRETYDFHLERIRATVQHDRELSAYVERHIHSKRHLFANHLIQHYPGNLGRQGNAPAEANHSSVLARLGPAFYESPVRLIQALLTRHEQISGERDRIIRTYDFESHGESSHLRDGIKKQALLALGSWGMELFGACMETSETMDMMTQMDGMCAFVEKSHPDRILLTLHPSAEECSCTFWIAYNMQCPHLLLLRKKFDATLFSRRWLKFSCLETSAGSAHVESEFANFSHESSVGKEESNFDEVVAAAINNNDACQIACSASTEATQMESSNIHRLLREIGYMVVALRDKKKKNLYCGHLLKLSEMLKGNEERVQGMSLESLLEAHVSLFARPSTRKIVFSRENTINQGKTFGIETLSSQERPTLCMTRGGPPLPNSHSKKRKMSSNEIMIQSTKKKPCCSLCYGQKHKANGCPFIGEYKANLVPPRDVRDMTTKLGNPLYFEVKQLDDETKRLIHQSTVSGVSNAVPEHAWHLVLVNTYFGPIPDQPHEYNVVEVTVLGQGGRQLPGLERVCFPVYSVKNWMRKHCGVTGRKKHILSALQSR
jgi:hypothetical protein